jgi:hypothetical protein
VLIKKKKKCSYNVQENTFIRLYTYHIHYVAFQKPSIIKHNYKISYLELSFLTVFALPNASRTGFDCTITSWKLVRNHECNIDQNKPQENKLTKQQKDNQNSEQYFFIIGKYAKLPILFIKAYIIK